MLVAFGRAIATQDAVSSDGRMSFVAESVVQEILGRTQLPVSDLVPLPRLLQFHGVDDEYMAETYTYMAQVTKCHFKRAYAIKWNYFTEIGLMSFVLR